jgi:hypothetical protein
MQKRISVSLAVGAILAIAIAVAGCGGSSSKSSSGTTSGNTTTTSTTSTGASGKNYQPSQTILQHLGYQQCSRQNISSTLFVNPNATNGAGDFAGGTVFTIAKNCSTGPKITVDAATFTTHEGIAFGKATIKKKYPKAGVGSFRTVVIGVIGGANPQALADAIIAQLSAGTATK